MKRISSMIVLLWVTQGVGWAADVSSGTAVAAAAPVAKPMDLAVISTYCGERRYSIDASDLRPKDIDILRQILSYKEDGKSELFSYPGQLHASDTAPRLSGQSVHKGPSLDHMLKLMHDPLFAKRAGQEWMKEFAALPDNQLNDAMMESLEERFGIEESNSVVSDANCNAIETKGVGAGL
jgi:hypothetical protein